MSERLGDVIHSACMSRRLVDHSAGGCIPANFFWCKGVRFHQDMWNWFTYIQKCPKTFRKFTRTIRNTSKDAPNIFGSQSHDVLCQAQPQLFSFKNWRIFCGRTVIYMFWVQTTCLHICQTFIRYGRNNSYFPVRHEIEVFDPQTWDSCLRHDSWQVYCCSNNFAKNEI